MESHNRFSASLHFSSSQKHTEPVPKVPDIYDLWFQIFVVLRIARCGSQILVQDVDGF
jgi:hypothetical protein